MQTYSSHMDTDQNEELYDEGEKVRWGGARQYIERS
jgi:hypothetical protein